MGRPGLTNHRKFHRLTRMLGSAMLARGAVELMWESCYECGDDYVGTADDLEHLVAWTSSRSGRRNLCVQVFNSRCTGRSTGRRSR